MSRAAGKEGVRDMDGHNGTCAREIAMSSHGSSTVVGFDQTNKPLSRWNQAIRVGVGDL